MVPPISVNPNLSATKNAQTFVSFGSSNEFLFPAGNPPAADVVAPCDLLTPLADGLAGAAAKPTFTGDPGGEDVPPPLPLIDDLDVGGGCCCRPQLPVVACDPQPADVEDDDGLAAGAGVGATLAFEVPVGQITRSYKPPSPMNIFSLYVWPTVAAPLTIVITL